MAYKIHYTIIRFSQHWPQPELHENRFGIRERVMWVDTPKKTETGRESRCLEVGNWNDVLNVSHDLLNGTSMSGALDEAVIDRIEKL
jgi:hypothetical protein